MYIYDSGKVSTMGIAEGTASKRTPTRPQQARGSEAEPRAAGQQHLRKEKHAMSKSDCGGVMVDRSLPGAGVGLVALQSSGRSAVESAGELHLPARCSSSLHELLLTSITSMDNNPGLERRGRRREQQSRYGGFPSGSRRLPPARVFNQLKDSD